jgi:hypothetical protein
MFWSFTLIVVSLASTEAGVAVGFSKGDGWHHGSHHHYVFDIHNTIFYVVSYSYREDS